MGVGGGGGEGVGVAVGVGVGVRGWGRGSSPTKLCLDHRYVAVTTTMPATCR